MTPSRLLVSAGGDRSRMAVLLAVLALAAVVLLAEQGGFTRLSRGAELAPAIPDITIGDGDDHLPVVTSVRSNGRAERAGVRVGDEITTIDGRPVHSAAALRAFVIAQGKGQPLALHILRGNAVLSMVIDRSVPGKTATGMRNGAENPAD